MSTFLLYQYPPKSSIGAFCFFQNPGQGLVKKSLLCPGFQALRPGLPGRKPAPKGRPHGKPSVAFGPHPPPLRWPALERGTPCLRPAALRGNKRGKMRAVPLGGPVRGSCAKAEARISPRDTDAGRPFLLSACRAAKRCPAGPRGRRSRDPAGRALPGVREGPCGRAAKAFGGWNAQPGRGCRSFWG